MPKDRRARSLSLGHSFRASPFPCSSSKHRKDDSSSSSSSRNSSKYLVEDKDAKEWDDVLCPICMEHPHNAVLLLCTSCEKGCRAFMCDTSPRHSNCFDQFRKAFTGPTTSRESMEDGVQLPKTTCPLCRGAVTGWTVVEAARRYLNTRTRSCSMETCGFEGTYEKLRKHARMEHPAARSTVADPERLQEWNRTERRQNLGDLISSVQSALGADDDGPLHDDDGVLGENHLYLADLETNTIMHVQVVGMDGTAQFLSELRFVSRASTRRSVISTRGLGSSAETDEEDTPIADPVSDRGIQNEVDIHEYMLHPAARPEYPYLPMPEYLQPSQDPHQRRMHRRQTQGPRGQIDEDEIASVHGVLFMTNFGRDIDIWHDEGLNGPGFLPFHPVAVPQGSWRRRAHRRQRWGSWMETGDEETSVARGLRSSPNSGSGLDIWDGEDLYRPEYLPMRSAARQEYPPSLRHRPPQRRTRRPRVVEDGGEYTL